MKKQLSICVCALLISCTAFAQEAASTSWSADNGNGTYTNPLFYDEFSDPDMIRVGEDFYLVGTTMHSVPGVVVLHSKDLVNWKLLSYCFDRFDMGDVFSLQNGKESYGQGIWAPCIRYHDGKFYIFSNMNGHGLQVFVSEDPAGPWEHIRMDYGIHDLSVLFDDDGKIYAIFSYDDVRAVQLKDDLTGIVEGSERIIIPRGNAMGEGHHIYKINGKYYIISADYAPMGRMQCARADNIDGPWETVTISMRETMGANAVHGVSAKGDFMKDGTAFDVSTPGANSMGCATLHQGGIVDLPNGEWWGFSMQDFHSVGRTTCLSPVTWVDGWPYFGLPGNLGRSPRTWTKPNVSAVTGICAPYQRSDDFNGKALQKVWQWNHDPDNSNWSLTKGRLRIQSQPAENFLWARNTLTQRGIGPLSVNTVTVDASHLKDGDVAGLGLMNMPYAWIGVVKEGKDATVTFYDQNGNERTEGAKMEGSKVYLRATCHLEVDSAQLSYSFDGKTFTNLGHGVVLPYQLKTFQGTRMALFAFNTKDTKGGYVDFDDFTVEEPMADRSGNLPLGKVITLRNLGNNLYAWANPHGMLHVAGEWDRQYKDGECQFRVLDRGKGKVALEAMNGMGFLTVVGAGLSADVRLTKEESEGSLFMWQDMLYNQCMLLSLKTNRYVGTDPTTGEPYAADWSGPSPDRKNGTVFEWKVVE